MPHSIDEEKLRIPAFLRRRSLSAKSKKKLILTALDRKKAGLLHVPQKISGTPRKISYTEKRLVESAFAKPRKMMMPVARKKITRPAASKQLFAMPLLGEIIKPKKRKMKIIGKVTHYYDKIKVAVIKLKGPLKLGDRIELPSPYGDFEQVIDSMQINRKDVKRAGKGKEIGIKVFQIVSLDGNALMVN